MPLPWLTVGGIVLSAQTANGFEGAGVVMFLASVGMLALIVLPYTTRTRRLAIDRPVAYLALLLIALAGLGVVCWSCSPSAQPLPSCRGALIAPDPHRTDGGPWHTNEQRSHRHRAHVGCRHTSQRRPTTLPVRRGR